MIASLRGQVIGRSDEAVVIEVGGVGYQVQGTRSTLSALLAEEGEAFVHIHHHIREDVQILFGFGSIEERQVFEALISTHGVGPSLALAILSVHSPLALRKVVGSEDVAALCLVPGVGKKTAARLLIELKNKLDLPFSEEEAAGNSAVGDPTDDDHSRRDVREALAGLGYASDEIAAALADLPDQVDSADLLRQALQRLAVS